MNEELILKVFMKEIDSLVSENSEGLELLHSFETALRNTWSDCEIRNQRIGPADIYRVIRSAVQNKEDYNKHAILYYYLTIIGVDEAKSRIDARLTSLLKT